MRVLFLAFFAAAILPQEIARAADPEKGAAALSLLKAMDEGFVQVYEKVAPTVVVIEASNRPEEEETDTIKGFDLFFEDGKEPRKEKDGGSRQWRLPSPSTHSEGSGFIIRADGFIVTNYHVVADAGTIRVRLKDGRTFPAKLVGTDDKSDIAVLKIDAKDLPVAKLGDSDALRVGQMVCAIGTPFSQDFSFTAGFVSGKDRMNLLGPTSSTILYEDYIQTDAFINPGNSGGPLFDVEGRVVGMNTLIHGLGRGMAFAIPSRMLRDVGDQLIATGKVQRPWLGIRIETLGENEALREHITGVDKGVVVNTIEANAPAYKSDLRPADVITDVDGVKVATTLDLQKEILKKKVGQTVQLSVWRGGSAMKIAVATEELPAPAPMTKVANFTAKLAEGARLEGLGLRLRDTNEGAVSVTEVVPNSPAAKAEIAIDDVITAVETKPMQSSSTCAAAIIAAMDMKGSKGVILNIDRKGKRTFVVLHPEK
jgi:serine protease Do